MVVGVIQARMSSTRLPGKCLMDIKGKPMLEWVYRRCAKSDIVKSWVIATSIDPSDDPIEDFCNEKGITVFRGSLDDVLDRYYKIATALQAKHVVRITSDCPLIDPGVIDYCVALHVLHGKEYTANILEPRFPDGLDVEVMTYEALKDAWENATQPDHREHVTPWVRLHTDHVDMASVVLQGLDYSSMRWTVDYPEDAEFINAVFAELDPLTCDMFEVVKLLGVKPVIVVNSMYKRNEKYEGDKE